MANSDFEDAGGIEDVGGREVEASEGSGLDRIANVSGEEIKSYLQDYTAEKADDGVSSDNDEPEEEAPAKLGKEDYDAAWSSLTSRYPDASDMVDEMTDYLERHPNKYSSPKDRGELVHELENVYAGVHGGIDLAELSTEAKDAELNKALDAGYESGDFASKLEALAGKVGMTDPVVGEYLQEVMETQPQVFDELVQGVGAEQMNKSLDAIGDLVTGKGKYAQAYQDEGVQQLTEMFMNEVGLDVLLDPSLAPAVFEKAVKAAIRAKSEDEKGQFRSAFAQALPNSDEAIKDELIEGAYQDFDFEEVFDETATLEDISMADVRAGIKSQFQQSQEISAENNAAFARALKYRDEQNRKRGLDNLGNTGPRLGI